LHIVEDRFAWFTRCLGVARRRAQRQVFSIPMHSPKKGSVSPNEFPDTNWTILAQLRDPATREDAREALCRVYWKPAHAFLCMKAGPDLAEDLTQEFMLMALQKEVFEGADQTKGRLRSWLLGVLTKFWAGRARTAATIRRGGDRQILSLEGEGSVEEIRKLQDGAATPEEAFDRAWVTALVQEARDRLRENYENAQRGEIYRILLPWIVERDGAENHHLAAKEMGVSVANFRVQLNRLRGHYRDELRRQIQLTLDEGDSLNEEMAYLFSLFGKPTGSGIANPKSTA
jgi:DNA-directed RNA polymerase specialized sigma24 family protein